MIRNGRNHYGETKKPSSCHDTLFVILVDPAHIAFIVLAEYESPSACNHKPYSTVVLRGGPARSPVSGALGSGGAGASSVR